MDLYVYSDESGVFDRKHNDIFVYGGIVFLSKEDKENFTRKYLHAERALRTGGKYSDSPEIKASVISNKDKGKLFRSTNACFRFGIIIHMDRMIPSIFNDKKSKQRYLDYAYKVGLKRFLIHLMNTGCFSYNEVRMINVYNDEHTTATNGRYELREALLQEYKKGTYNESWSVFFPPVFPDLNDVTLQFCDSSKRPLIRAADIIANKVFHAALTGTVDDLPLFVTELP